MLLLLIAQAQGATLQVPSSYSTIQGAINNASNGDTIRVADGTYVESLDTKGKNLTIVSVNGSGSTTIDGTGDDNVVSVDDGETVTLTGFTLTGADQGVFVNGSTLTADDIEVTGVTGGSSGGGFLISNGATATVSNCLIDNVTLTNSQYGGGFSINSSTVNIDGCVIRDTTAYQGGGIYIDDSTVDVSNTTINRAESEWRGGGLRIRGNSTVTGTKMVVKNSISGDVGGGVQAEDSTFVCTNCVIQNNTAADSGGGIYFRDQDAYKGLQLLGSSSLVSGNETTAGSGGGIYCWDGNLTVKGTMSDNVVPEGGTGAAVYFGGKNLTFVNADISGHDGEDGGAVYAGATTLSVSVTGGTWSDNTGSGDGGALFSRAPTEISGTTFTANSADGTGGAVYVWDQDLILLDSTLTENSAVRGGAVRVYQANLTARRNTFARNEAEYGAGLYHQAGSATTAELIVSSSDFNDNIAGTEGGGLYADGFTKGTMSGNDYRRNSPEGAALYNGKGLVAKDELYLDNTGDGMSAFSVQTMDLLRSRFINNGGNGLAFTSMKGLELYNAVAIGNSEAGFLLSNSVSNVLVRNCDAVDNDIGFDVRYGDLDLRNSIAAFNDSSGFRATSAAPVIEYCNSDGNGANWGTGTDGSATGNMSQDPEYSSFSNDGNGLNDLLFLGSTSPCRNAGDPGFSDSDGSRSDMGSFGGPDAQNEDLDGDGYKPSDGDCDEDDADVNPGATDTWYDGVDSDCDGANDYDRDGDGWLHESSGATEYDCDDTDPDIHPGAPDTSGDGVDSDCDGGDGEDTGDTDDTGDTGSGGDDTGTGDAWWTDADGDGFAPAQGDCDDGNELIHPDAVEVCDDGIDNDCDQALDSIDAECTGSACVGCGSTGSPAGWALVVLALGAGVLRRRRSVLAGR